MNRGRGREEDRKGIRMKREKTLEIKKENET